MVTLVCALQGGTPIGTGVDVCISLSVREVVSCALMWSLLLAHCKL